MIVKNTQQDIIFDTKKTKIGMKISGGADSAIVLYMLSKYVTGTSALKSGLSHVARINSASNKS